MHISVWYHAKIEGHGIPDKDYALEVASEQMMVLSSCGLSEAAEEIHIGINGEKSSVYKLTEIVPRKSKIYFHGERATTELTTLKLLQEWLPNDEDWFVLYHHTKGVTHPWDINFARWRNRMECECVVKWSRCINDLQNGYDAVGCHYIPPQGPPHTGVPFFGGTFWWSTSKYLKQLPPVSAPLWENRYHAEDWIGNRNPPPKIMDYRPGWP